MPTCSDCSAPDMMYGPLPMSLNLSSADAVTDHEMREMEEWHAEREYGNTDTNIDTNIDTNTSPEEAMDLCGCTQKRKGGKISILDLLHC